MRVRPSPNDTHSLPQQLGAAYDRLVFDRALLLVLHFALGFAAAFMYLTSFEQNHIFRFMARGVGAHMLLKTTPAWIPYLNSGLYSRRCLPAKRSGLGLFVLVLVVGTAAVGYVYLTPVVHEISIFLVMMVQAAAYVLAAAFFLEPETDD